jgi:hypothetical protein
MGIAASFWIGQDSRELLAYDVAAESFRRHMRRPLYPVHPISLTDVRRRGLYWRIHESHPPAVEGGREVIWDKISQAPMATEFSITRFLTPVLARAAGQREGWAIFTDCDVLVRRPVDELLELLRPEFAVMCVQHEHVPTETTKMRGEVQTTYARKNWSSVVAYNLEHDANVELDLDLVNASPGRGLHGFRWLRDSEIGALPSSWNYLIGTTSPRTDVALAHFTDGLPNMPGHEHDEYANEWWELAQRLGG